MNKTVRWVFFGVIFWGIPMAFVTAVAMTLCDFPRLERFGKGDLKTFIHFLKYSGPICSLVGSIFGMYWLKVWEKNNSSTMKK